MAPTFLSEWFVAGLLADIASASVAILVGFSGLFGGGAHYGAILVRLPERDIEIATAAGFFFGAAVGAVVLLLEALS